MRRRKEKVYVHYKITASHLIMAQQVPEDPTEARGAIYIPSITDEKSHFPWGGHVYLGNVTLEANRWQL